MSSQLRSELLKAANSTFERLGFVVPDEELLEQQAAAPLAHAASVRFRGPVNGSFHIHMSDSVAAQLTANMLGADSDGDPQAVRDALGEIANVVCGNLVPSLGSAADVFDLEAPQAGARVDAVPLPIADAAARVELGIDEGRAELWLFIDGSAPRHRA